MSLNKDNNNQAYLCGRLFAILEKIQRDSEKTKLNRTIKDSSFTSAANNPSLTFPDLLKKAQHHLKRMDNPVFHNKLLGEIMDKIEGFPERLPLIEQGKFMLGYYQQYEAFFESKKNKEENENKNESEREE